jgi:hypothetical protein
MVLGMAIPISKVLLDMLVREGILLGVPSHILARGVGDLHLRRVLDRADHRELVRGCSAKRVTADTL